LGKVNLPLETFWAEAELADVQMAINPNVAIATMRVNLVFMLGSLSRLEFRSCHSPKLWKAINRVP
jgi:hypothetical protein